MIAIGTKVRVVTEIGKEKPGQRVACHFLKLGAEGTVVAGDKITDMVYVQVEGDYRQLLKETDFEVIA